MLLLLTGGVAIDVEPLVSFNDWPRPIIKGPGPEMGDADAKSSFCGPPVGSGAV